MTCCGVECSIVDVVAIFGGTVSGVFLQEFQMSDYRIQWNPPGIVHGLHVNCTISSLFHMESMVTME